MPKCPLLIYANRMLPLPTTQLPEMTQADLVLVKKSLFAAVYFPLSSNTACMLIFVGCIFRLHTDLVLVFDIKSSAFDEVFHHWQVSIPHCPVECCILCISEIKHVTSHFRSKVLGNANMAAVSRYVKSIESSLCMYIQHKQNTRHTDIRRSGIKHNQ